MSKIHISTSLHETSSNEEENELLYIVFIKNNTVSVQFKSSECKWSTFDDAITVTMNNGKFYFFPMTSILYYYIESLKEEEKNEQGRAKSD